MAPHVNDAVVTEIITQSLARVPARSAKTTVERVWQAFVSLQARRRQVEPLNLDLAAAEHYMYARYLAGASGDPTVKLAPTLYGLKKRVYFALGIEQRMATTHLPVLPPSQAVERWGQQGAVAGLADYTAVTGRPAINLGGAASALLSEARRYN